MTEIIIIGEPNVGKSSFISALVESSHEIEIHYSPFTTKKVSQYNFVSHDQDRRLLLQLTDTIGFNDTAEILEISEKEKYDLKSTRLQEIIAERANIKSSKVDYTCRVLNYIQQKPESDNIVLLLAVNCSCPPTIDSEINIEESKIYRLIKLLTSFERPFGLVMLKHSENDFSSEWRNVFKLATHSDWVSSPIDNMGDSLITTEVFLDFLISSKIPVIQEPTHAEILKGRRTRRENLRQESASILLSRLQEIINFSKTYKRKRKEDKEQYKKRIEQEYIKSMSNICYGYSTQIFKLSGHNNQLAEAVIDNFKIDINFKGSLITFGSVALACTSAGLAVDVMSFGLTHGLGTLIGGAIGVVSGYLAPDLAEKDYQIKPLKITDENSLQFIGLIINFTIIYSLSIATPHCLRGLVELGKLWEDNDKLSSVFNNNIANFFKQKDITKAIDSIVNELSKDSNSINYHASTYKERFESLLKLVEPFGSKLINQPEIRDELFKGE